jgi:SAM-dependent methyltransferase
LSDQIINRVKNYYDEKLKKHGATHWGVDWNSEESQNLRFEKLLFVVDPKDAEFSLTDYGCGYGALFSYLRENRRPVVAYCGYDISENMVCEAGKLYSGNKECRFLSEEERLPSLDYTVASGIFNVRLENQEKTWEDYIIKTLHHFDELSTKGFSFNMLTLYSDIEYRKDYLYYADPLFYFDYCKKHFSRFVSLIHDYPLYEFTICVRK